MEPSNILLESDSDESSTLSLRDLPLHSNGEPSRTDNPSSPPPDVFEFSFPLSLAAVENSSFMSDVFLHDDPLPNNSAPTPKLPPFVHRRAESLDGNDREAHAVDYQRLRRACSDPRPTSAAGRWRKWPFFCAGIGEASDRAGDEGYEEQTKAAGATGGGCVLRPWELLEYPPSAQLQGRGYNRSFAARRHRPSSGGFYSRGPFRKVRCCGFMN